MVQYPLQLKMVSKIKGIALKVTDHSEQFLNHFFDNQGIDRQSPLLPVRLASINLFKGKR